MLPIEKSQYIADTLRERYAADLIEHLRDVARELEPELTDAQRDVAVAIAGVILQPNPLWLGLPPTKSELHTELPLGLNDAEIEFGMRLFQECRSRRAAERTSS